MDISACRQKTEISKLWQQTDRNVIKQYETGIQLQGLGLGNKLRVPVIEGSGNERWGGKKQQQQNKLWNLKKLAKQAKSMK